MFKKIKSFFRKNSKPTPTPTPTLAPAPKPMPKTYIVAEKSAQIPTGSQLELHESPDFVPALIATNPSALQIEETIMSQSWNELTFVFLKYDEENLMELSGSLDDGLSGRFLENGREHITQYGPGSLGELVELLQSYAADDDAWRSIVEWNQF